MEATASKGVGLITAGELIVQNGRCAGMRRPLGAPLTFIGRTQGCDLRLNIDGVDDLHCLLVLGPTGLVLRDLGSAGGTRVNGHKITQADVHDGDLVAVGPFEFLLHLPPPEVQADPAASTEEPRNDLRVQAAAVAAQQAALDEEEVRLQERKTALEQQEDQLAVHLEEKRRSLQVQSDRNQAEHAALARDRDAYDRNINKITGDLTQAQQDLVENQQKLQTERHRLADLHRRLRQRYHRFWLGQRQAYQRKETDLAAERASLQAEQEEQKAQATVLLNRRLSTNTDMELGRHHLKEAWDKVRHAQFRWKHRRGQERAALKVRERLIEEGEAALAAGQADRTLWESRRAGLLLEVAGLDERARNHRSLLFQQQTELRALEEQALSQRRQIAKRQGELHRCEAQIQERHAILALLPAPPVDEKGGPSTVPTSPEIPAMPARTIKPTPLLLVEAPPAPPAAEPLDLAVVKRQWQTRLDNLNRHAGDLADQRLHLLEHWQRLALVHQGWHGERRGMLEALEDWSLRLQQFEQQLGQREVDQTETNRLLRERQEDLLRLRHELVAWRAHLQVEQSTWEGQREQLLAELRQREDYAEHQMQSLLEVKQCWHQRRREEVTHHQADRAALVTLHQHYLQSRQELAARLTALETDKRVLAEKALVLEQYRQEFLTKALHPGAERRLERLRRRWLTQNAAALRAAARERQAMAADLGVLEDRFQELERHAALVDAARAELMETQTAWEHKQTETEARQARLENALDCAETQRALADHQLIQLREEIERIARSLYEPGPMEVAQAA